MHRLVQLERHAMAGVPREFRRKSLPEVGIERKTAPLGCGKPTKIPVKWLPGWANLVYKPYFSVSMHYSRCPKAGFPADLATLRNRLTELEWAEEAKKCHFKT